jgi:predicted nucleic acid-binding protein
MSVDFIDSNVVLYLFDETAPRKRAKAENLIQSALQTGSALISHQVVQETLNVLTSKRKPAAMPEQARRFLDSVLVPLWRVMPNAALYRRALDVQQRYAFSFYDAQIVAAALEAGCARLLTEDLQDGQRIESLVVVNPFRT